VVFLEEERKGSSDSRSMSRRRSCLLRETGREGEGRGRSKPRGGQICEGGMGAAFGK